MAKDQRSTPRQRLIAKLERRLIKTALARFAEWHKEFGKPKPEDFLDRKKSYAHLLAAQNLYEAINGK